LAQTLNVTGVERGEQERYPVSVLPDAACRYPVMLGSRVGAKREGDVYLGVADQARRVGFHEQAAEAHVQDLSTEWELPGDMERDVELHRLPWTPAIVFLCLPRHSDSSRPTD